MSKKLVEDVSKENPTLLQQNLGHTCYQHTLLLVKKLRAAGRDAHLMCKSPGEGQYTPPGFASRTVTGFDGKSYPCSGVSHDAIYCDGKQFDTLVAANEHDRPIYRRNGSGTDDDPNWSFNPADGPQITASPTWDEIPRHKWRANNPPLPDSTFVGVPVPGPALPPLSSTIRLPSYAELGDAKFFVGKVGVPLFDDMATNGETMNAGSADWMARSVHGIIERFIKHGDHRDADEIAKKVRNEWRAVMNNPKLPQL